jgi:hypothetical protein
VQAERVAKCVAQPSSRNEPGTVALNAAFQQIRSCPSSTMYTAAGKYHTGDYTVAAELVLSFM